MIKDFTWVEYCALACIVLLLAFFVAASVWAQNIVDRPAAGSIVDDSYIGADPDLLILESTLLGYAENRLQKAIDNAPLRVTDHAGNTTVVSDFRIQLDSDGRVWVCEPALTADEWIEETAR